MPVTVHREPHPEPPYERCCFCRTRTTHWYTPPGTSRRKPLGNEIACCPECAKERTPAEMPTKDEWYAAERAWMEHERKRGVYPMRVDASYCPACGAPRPARVGNHMRAINKWKWRCPDCGVVFITTTEK